MHGVLITNAVARALSWLAVLPLAACLPATLLAQQPLGAGAGSRVRLELPGRRITGTLLSIGDDTVRVATCAHCSPVAVPRQGITSLEVSAGWHSSTGHAREGALIGLGVGLAFSLFSVERTLRDCRGGPCGPAVFVTPVFVLGGTFLGTLAGKLWRSERWVRVPLAIAY